jgi:transcriptional regulator GlxA family with amidase domain
VSICTGASVLAAAGLLDGRPAATHWAWAERIGGLYPQVAWDFDVLFMDDGNVLTSAGVGAGVDLCLHIVRSDHGAAVANRTARRCVVPPWRDGGQAQYIERPVPAANGAGTDSTRSWVLDRLAEPVTLEEMAGHARMSVRTFTRRFRDETGLSPRQWLLRQRVEHARILLESTDLAVDAVARRSGLGSATALRQHLHATIGVAPSAYRRTSAIDLSPQFGGKVSDWFLEPPFPPPLRNLWIKPSVRCSTPSSRSASTPTRWTGPPRRHNAAAGRSVPS